MKKSARSNWQMLVAVVQFLEKEIAKMNQIERIPQLVKSLREKQLLIQKLESERKRDITLVALTKKKHFEWLNEETVSLCGSLKSHAYHANIPTLKKKMHVTKSYLLIGGAASNLSKCIAYFNAAKEYKEVLPLYGWDDQRFAKHEELLDDVSILLTAPRQARTNQSKVIREVYKLLDECLEELNHQLDPLVYQLRLKWPFLVAEYNALRRSIKTGVRRQHLLGPIN